MNIEAADLGALAATAAHRIAWSNRGDDLNVNLVVLKADEAVDEHVNSEVDVLVIGVRGQGIVTVEDGEHALEAGHLLLIPKGYRRSIGAAGETFAYVTCHRRRAGLWPR